jgi:hypothetical protein
LTSEIIVVAAVLPLIVLPVVEEASILMERFPVGDGSLLLQEVRVMASSAPHTAKIPIFLFKSVVFMVGYLVFCIKPARQSFSPVRSGFF